MAGQVHPHDSFGLFPFGMTNLFDPRASGIPSDLAKFFEGPMESNNGFMYRVPRVPPHAMVEDVEDEDVEDKRDEGSQEVDANILAERLQILKGLQGYSTETLQTQAEQAGLNRPQLQPPHSPSRSPNPHSHPAQSPPQHIPPEYYLSPNRLPHSLRKFPIAEELRPSDSISMYRPHRAPSRSTRRGGTNVDGDPASPGSADYIPQQGYAQSKEGGSFVSDGGGMTMQTPRSMGYLDQATAPPTSQWTTGTLAGDMYNMRERLLKDAELKNHTSDEHIKTQLNSTANLAATVVKLERAEEQLRTLQATLFAEQVARTQVEREAEQSREDIKDCKDELASAIRALRRARDEGQRGDEERKRLQRCFETSKNQLHKYHGELKVRDARAKGREEGRAEAWKEAEMWMGGSPPIPIDPIQSIPPEVFRQTPMMGGHQQPDPSQYQQPGQYTSPPQMVSPQQNYPAGQQQGYFQPMVIPQQDQQQLGQMPPQQQRPIQPQHTAQTMQPQPTGQPMRPQHTAQTMQPQHTAQMIQPQHTAQTMQPQHTAQTMQPQHTAQTMQPQHTAQTMQGQQLPHILQPQMTGFQPTGILIPDIARPMTPPHLVGIPVIPVIPVAQPVPIPVSQQAPGGQWMQPPMSTNAYAPATRSVPHRTSALPPQQLARAATVINSSRRPGPRPQQPHGKHQTPSTNINIPGPESVTRPHPADSYLDRAEHDLRLKSLLSGAQSKTIHTSEFPSSDHNEIHSASTDKPLPDPFHHASVLGKSQSTRRPTNGSHRPSRRLSLSDGLHPTTPPHHHSHRGEQHFDGDRYPTFPVNGPSGPAGHGGHAAHAKGHSRHSSFTSVNPANYALPASMAPSMMQTPQSTNRQQSLRPTLSQMAARNRSRMAGALRADAELDPGELSQILEETHNPHAHSHAQAHYNKHGLDRAPSRGTSKGHAAPQPTELRSPQHPMESMVMRNMAPVDQQQVPRKAPSMPPMRFQPRPVMPPMLGANKARSEAPGYDPRSTRQPPVHDPRGPDDPPHSHALFLPPGMMNRTKSGETEEINQHRHSALGLEGVNGQRSGSALGHGHGPESHGHSKQDSHAGTMASRMRAPTITIQPPSSRSNNLSGRPSISPSFVSEATAKHGAQVYNGDEYYDMAHQVPLPPSMTTSIPHTRPSTHTHGRTMSDVDALKQVHERLVMTNPNLPPMAQPQPHQVPFPKPRSQAPTAYDMLTPVTSPRSVHTARSRHGTMHQRADGHHTVGTLKTMPSVSIIDYAMTKPLPVSRANSSPKTTATEFDEDKIQELHSTKNVRRKPVPAGPAPVQTSQRSQAIHGPMDPRKIPLPESRPPTRARASTYARTEGTIEEVTEEESGRENKAMGRRW